MLNDTASNPLIFTENLLSAALNDLTSRGVLHASNRMTVEEIFKAVMDSKAQRENAAANNGDNADIDDDTLIEPPSVAS